MRFRSLTLGAAAVAACLALTPLHTTTATASAGEQQPTASITVSSPQVQAKVTRLLFTVPQTLDELKVALTGLKPLLLRYTGDIGGGDQPGPGVPADQAIESMRASVLKEFGVEPLVFLVVVDGEVPAAQLEALEPVLTEAKVFDSDVSAVDQLPSGTLEKAANATLARETLLGRRAEVKAAAEESRQGAPSADQPTAPANITNTWAPWYGTMQAYNDPYESPTDMPRKFRHYLRWYSSK